MRVNSSTSNAVQNSASSETTEASAAKKSQRSEKAPAKAKLVEAGDISGAKSEISGKAKEMAQAKSIAAAAPDVREGKIEALRAKILAGKYKVDSEAIADKMVDEHIRTAEMG